LSPGQCLEEPPRHIGRPKSMRASWRLAGLEQELRQLVEYRECHGGEMIYAEAPESLSEPITIDLPFVIHMLVRSSASCLDPA